MKPASSGLLESATFNPFWFDAHVEMEGEALVK